jgi:hypothetical protein
MPANVVVPEVGESIVDGAVSKRVRTKPGSAPKPEQVAG